MMTFRKASTSAVLLLLAGVFALAGCSSDTAPLPEEPQPTVEPVAAIAFQAIEDPSSDVDTTMTPTWEKTSEDTVAVYLYGSSACEPTVTGATYVAPGVITLALESYEGVACTMDFGGPFVWELSNLTDDTLAVETCATVGGLCTPLPEKR